MREADGYIHQQLYDWRVLLYERWSNGLRECADFLFVSCKVYLRKKGFFFTLNFMLKGKYLWKFT